jgi:hypothetical protein
MIRTCSKCGDYYADGALAFCLVDGTPLIDVDPGTEIWSEGARVVEEKASALRKLSRKLKWRRVFMSAMTTVIVTLVVCVVTVNSFIYLRPKQEEEVSATRAATETAVKMVASTPALPACSDADKSRERAAIIKEFSDTWRRDIEGDRPEVIAENLPAFAENGEAGLSPLGFESTFTDLCTTASLTVSYRWEVTFNLNGTTTVVPISKQKKFTCAKAEGAWRCS